jgi:hypothetical protein
MSIVQAMVEPTTSCTAGRHSSKEIFEHWLNNCHFKPLHGLLLLPIRNPYKISRTYLVESECGGRVALDKHVAASSLFWKRVVITYFIPDNHMNKLWKQRTFYSTASIFQNLPSGQFFCWFIIQFAKMLLSFIKSIDIFRIWKKPRLVNTWLKGHGNEPVFLMFLHKYLCPRSLTLPFKPFWFWLRILWDICIGKSTPCIGESGSRQDCLEYPFFSNPLIALLW